MSSFHRIQLLILLATCLVSGEVRAQVSAPEARIAVLEKAEHFTATTPSGIPGALADTPDPFYPESHYPSPAAEPGAPAGTAEAQPKRDLPSLSQLAEQINPTGIMKFGTRTMLLFGERRLAEGDVLPVQHLGTNYSVEILSISTNSFTLRFNGEVLSKRIQ